MMWPSWSWSYGSWIYNYLCNRCLSPLSCELESRSWTDVLDTTCDHDHHGRYCYWSFESTTKILTVPNGWLPMASSSLKKYWVILDSLWSESSTSTPTSTSTSTEKITTKPQQLRSYYNFSKSITSSCISWNKHNYTAISAFIAYIKVYL